MTRSTQRHSFLARNMIFRLRCDIVDILCAENMQTSTEYTEKNKSNSCQRRGKSIGFATIYYVNNTIQYSYNNVGVSKLNIVSDETNADDDEHSCIFII